MGAYSNPTIENRNPQIVPMGRWIENLEQFAIDVILERRRGIRANPFCVHLFMRLSFIYERIVQLRLLSLSEASSPRARPGCLVISIGNLTVGGTGKTPVVEKFARALQTGGRRVAILSRGYKSMPRPSKRGWLDRIAKGDRPTAGGFRWEIASAGFVNGWRRAVHARA